MNFQAFKSKYQKAPVKEYPNSVTDSPVVSVCVMTYQHKDYIRECLDSILMQQTDFPFEILLGDDASTDGTREMCIEYAERHPDTIRLFLHDRANNIHINGSPTGRFNFLYSLYSARGKYIALCEGDDYWTDPEKLKKQLTIFQHNPEIGICYTLVKKCFPPYKSERLEKLNINKSFYSLDEYIEDDTPFINTCSWLVDSYLLKDIESIDSFAFGDLQIALSILNKKKVIYCLEEVMAVYRVLNQSASHFDKNKKREVAFFYDKVMCQCAYISDAKKKKVKLQQFYIKYFHLLPLLSFNYYKRLRIVSLLPKKKSKKSLLKYLFNG